MKTWKSRPIVVILGVLLLTIVGCSSDSPTEPSKPGAGNPIPPSDDIVITVTVTNVTRDAATLTAAITSGGSVVADGTAVEFETSAGTFEETGTAYALRSTISSAAAVKILSEGVENAVVRVRVRSTLRDTLVTFAEGPVEGAPLIISISPSSGSPSGGYVATITGGNFFDPVRVFFGVNEAVVASRTDTELKVVVPSVDLGATGQFDEVAVTVIARAGTEDEVSGGTGTPDNSPDTDDGFRYELDILTPVIYAVSPSSGPNEGNTRIVIFGEGFQSPLKAWFGASNSRVDLEVVSISFSQVIAITPPAAGLGSDFLNNSVNLTIQNIASNKTGSLSSAFRYGPDIQITNVSPNSGTYLGGTRVTINGFGFDDPVAVFLDGVPAQVIRVSGTEIIAIASAPEIVNCAVSGGGGGASGEVVVTNIETGATTSSQDGTNVAGFSYVFNEPVITFLSPTAPTEGGALSISVLNPGIGQIIFSIDDKKAFPTPASASQAAGTQVYTITVPSGFEFDTEDCTTGGGSPGEANAPTDFTLQFENVITGCESDLEITIVPADTSCQAGPVGTISPDPVAFGLVAEGTNDQITVFVGNIGSADLVVTSISLVGDGEFTRSAISSSTITAGSSETIDIDFDPPVVGADTDYTATLTLGTNAGDLVVDITGTGDAP